ncbi:MAG: hypothetical protein WBX22_11985 [Silvibacterium sp.]
MLKRTQEEGIAPWASSLPVQLAWKFYAVLMGCGLGLSQDSRMTELCHCTKNLIETKAFDIARVDLVVYSKPSKQSQNESQTARLG